MGKPLDEVEHIGKWIIGVGLILALLRQVWKILVKSYRYLQKSNERFEMLQSIIDNQEYSRVERQAIMNKISLGYFKTNLEGQSIEIGEVVCNVFGYSEDELLKFGWSSFIHPDDQD